MTRMTPGSCRDWLEHNQFVREGHHVFPSGRPVYAIDFSQPSSARALAVLARHMANVFEGCPHVLLVIDEWGVWPTEEMPQLFTHAMAGYGDARPLKEAPGFMFTGEERAVLKEFIQFALISGWSAIVVCAAAPLGFCLTDDDWIGLYADSHRIALEWCKNTDLTSDDAILWQGQVQHPPANNEPNTTNR